MNLKEIIEFQKRAEDGDVTDNEIDNHIAKVGEYIESKAKQGMDVVVSGMGEEKFVRLVREFEKCNVTLMGEEGIGAFLMLAGLDGSLKPLLHTMILSVLGVLIDEEVV